MISFKTCGLCGKIEPDCIAERLSITNNEKMSLEQSQRMFLRHGHDPTDLKFVEGVYTYPIPRGKELEEPKPLPITRQNIKEPEIKIRKPKIKRFHKCFFVRVSRELFSKLDFEATETYKTIPQVAREILEAYKFPE